MSNDDKPVYSNTFRTTLEENAVILNFAFTLGSTDKSSNSDVTDVKTVVVPPDQLDALIYQLFEAGVNYTKKFNRDIGDLFSLYIKQQEQTK